MANRPNLAALAWRNLWRNRRRTLITVFGIAFGMFLAVIFTGLGDASYSKMIDDAAKGGAGHVTVQHREYADLPSPKKTVTGVGAITDAAKSHPEVERVIPRMTGAAMLATSSNSFGAFFMAIDPTIESPETLTFLDSIVEGEMFETGQDEGIILGATLAENLSAGIGKKVVYTVTDKSGEIVSNMARVRAIVKTGASGIDNGLCLIPLPALQALVGYAPDEVTQIGVFLHDNRDAPAIAEALQPVAQGEAEVLTWRETSPDLAGFIDMKMGSTYIMEGIIMVLLAAGIFNTLFVSVMERLREFGIMRAIGFSSRQLFGLIMWESFWLSIVGLLAAGALTWFPYSYLHANGIDYSDLVDPGTEVAGVVMDTTLLVGIYANHLIATCIVVVIATMAAGLYPAWRAGRVPPADAIRLI
jgi:ABC-type lipoprotein release transport system permease subunit